LAGLISGEPIIPYAPAFGRGILEESNKSMDILQPVRGIDQWIEHILCQLLMNGPAQRIFLKYQSFSPLNVSREWIGRHRGFRGIANRLWKSPPGRNIITRRPPPTASFRSLSCPWPEIARVARIHRCESLLLGLNDLSNPSAGVLPGAVDEFREL